MSNDLAGSVSCCSWEPSCVRPLLGNVAPRPGRSEKNGFGLGHRRPKFRGPLLRWRTRVDAVQTCQSHMNITSLPGCLPANQPLQPCLVFRSFGYRAGGCVYLFEMNSDDNLWLLANIPLWVLVFLRSAGDEQHVICFNVVLQQRQIVINSSNRVNSKKVQNFQITKPHHR